MSISNPTAKIFTTATGQLQVRRIRPKGVVLRGQPVDPKQPKIRKQYSIAMTPELWDAVVASCPERMSFNRYLVSLIEKGIA